jgi:hypothetical protein
MERTKNHKYIDDHLFDIDQKGRFLFIFEELNRTFDSSEQAIRRKLYH